MSDTPVVVAPWVQPIRQLLSERGWTQGELSRRAAIRDTTLSEVMNGRGPRMSTMTAIAGAFQVPLWTLFVTDRQRVVLESLTRDEDLSQRVADDVVQRLMGMLQDPSAAVTAGRHVVTAGRIPRAYTKGKKSA